MQHLHCNSELKYECKSHTYVTTLMYLHQETLVYEHSTSCLSHYTVRNKLSETRYHLNLYCSYTERIQRQSYLLCLEMELNQSRDSGRLYYPVLRSTYPADRQRFKVRNYIFLLVRFSLLQPKFIQLRFPDAPFFGSISVHSFCQIDRLSLLIPFLFRSFCTSLRICTFLNQI